MSPRNALVALSVVALAHAAGAETLYFKNKRTIEAVSYEIKGPLIYVRTTNGGRIVYLKADSVDWEATQKLKQGGVMLEKVDYAYADEGSEEAGGTAGSVLTAASLKKVGSGLKKRRAASPSIGVEVRAETGWTDSGINVKGGQTITFHVSGRVTIASGVEVGPEGSPQGKPTDAFVPDRPVGALLMRLGLGAEPILVTSGMRYTPPAPGRLYFGVNDKTLGDNSGAFSVRVDLPPVVPAAGSFSTATPGGSSAGAGAARSSAAAPGSAPAGRAPAQGMVGGVDKARGARGAAQGAPRSAGGE